MPSILLQIASRWLLPVLLVVSLIVLYRGHNLPGGGFIGGLIATSAFILVAFAEGVEAAQRRLRIAPLVLLTAGLALAFGSALLGVLLGDPFLTGLWLRWLPKVFTRIWDHRSPWTAVLPMIRMGMRFRIYGVAW